MCLGTQSTAPVFLPAALTEGMYPAQGWSQLLCVPLSCHTLPGIGAGRLLTANNYRQDTIGSGLAERLEPGLEGSQSRLTPLPSGGLLGDSRDLD